MTISRPPSGAAVGAAAVPGFHGLSNIASTVAATADINLRRDVYQEAWRKYVQYPPRTKMGAWLMANHARDSLYKREKYQRKVKDSAPTEPSIELDAVVEARESLREMARRCPRAFAFVLNYINQVRHSGADRRMACYYRQQLRACQ